MEKIKKPLSKSYPPTSINKKDLFEIESILKEESEEIEVLTEEYKYKSVKELIENSNDASPKELTLNSHSPYFCVELLKHSTRAYSSSSDNKSSGAFWKIDKILTKKGILGRFSFLLDFWVFFLSSTALQIIIGILNYKDLISSGMYNRILILIIFLYIVIVYTSINRHSKILLRDKKTWSWQENKNQFFVQVLAGFIVLFLWYLIMGQK